MAFFRQYIAPLFIFALFFLALAAVSARIFLPADMAQPAPVDDAALSEIGGSAGSSLGLVVQRPQLLQPLPQQSPHLWAAVAPGIE